ncbi:MAG TPA: DJ-1/PfpI family protein [Candidatus Paceibacterota bacterium]|nr:DJ-1/PfpI family protein [Candidatus Paceibacterota bacterium]
MATIALIIAEEGFQTKEYNDTKHMLESAGHKVITVSVHGGVAISNINEHIAVDMSLSELQLESIDGVYLIGGPGALRALDNPEMYKFLASVRDLPGMAYGSICVSTRVLAKAHVLEGQKATGWNGDRQLGDILSAGGATYIPQPVVEDGRVITADGPISAAGFGTAIAKRFKTS